MTHIIACLRVINQYSPCGWAACLCSNARYCVWCCIGLAAMRTIAAPMQQSRAVESLTCGPFARRRLDLHPLLTRVLLQRHRSCTMIAGPTDAWREPADLLRRFADREMGTLAVDPALDSTMYLVCILNVFIHNVCPNVGESSRARFRGSDSINDKIC